MTRELVFSVGMVPVGKARHRSVIGADGKPHSYSDKRMVAAEAEVRAAFRRAYPRHAAHEGPVEISVVASYVPAPSWAKWKRAAAIAGMWRCVVKPDWDNVGKLVTDALNKVAYVDDSQVFDARVFKQYDDSARLLVRIRLFDQPTRKDMDR